MVVFYLNDTQFQKLLNSIDSLTTAVNRLSEPGVDPQVIADQTAGLKASADRLTKVINQGEIP